MLISRILKFIQKTFLWILIVPIFLIIFGASLNQFCSIVNNDKFPVLTNEKYLMHHVSNLTITDDAIYIDSIHVVMDKNTHLNFLGDVFDFGTQMESIGDLFIDFGEWLEPVCLYIWIGVFGKIMWDTLKE